MKNHGISPSELSPIAQAIEDMYAGKDRQPQKVPLPIGTEVSRDALARAAHLENILNTSTSVAPQDLH